MNNQIAYLKKYIQDNNLDESYYNDCLLELKKGRPIQYIIGNVDFYGNIIEVNEDVLIPRFETELLVEKTIQRIKKYFPSKNIDILDLGTGSGCIAISLKKELPSSNIDALDISNKALKVAKSNAISNNVQINFINTDMTTYKNKQYDIIISNPPYIKENEKIEDIVKNNEPHIALYAKDDGLYFYKQIISNLKYLTKDKYLIAFEIGETLSTDIVDYTKKKFPNINISVEKDLSNKIRYIFITNIED